MSKTVDFKARKKDFLTVKFSDDTVIFVGTPTKKIFSALTTIQDELKDVTNVDENTLDSLYEACAVVMSRNKADREITKEYLENTLDFDDIIVFFTAYMDFVGELSNSKN